ncbi:MAG: thioredoxin domain-containing protein [Micropruina sp.]
MANTSQRERMRAAQQAAQRAARLRKLIVIGIGALALVLIVVFAVVALTGNKPAAGAATAMPPNATQAKDGIVVNPGKAKPGAPKVQLYFDFQCSHCLEFEEKFGLPLSTMASAGEIELIYSNKVFLDNGKRDGLSHKAALAATCSDTFGKYPDATQAIWAQALNGPYTDSLLRNNVPSAVGLNGDALTAFQKCYDDQATLDFVVGVEEAAVRNGIVPTPTVLVNGRDLPSSAWPTGDGMLIRQVILDAAKG